VFEVHLLLSQIGFLLLVVLEPDLVVQTISRELLLNLLEFLGFLNQLRRQIWKTDSSLLRIAKQSEIPVFESGFRARRLDYENSLLLCGHR
jgi:hypothetical protein